MVAKPRLSGTDLVHGDNSVLGASKLEVAPSISVTTTFRHPDDGSNAYDIDVHNPNRHVYSRYTQGISTRAEHILSKINNGHAITYSSGLTASYAALLALQPKRIAIRDGYHGCHATIQVFQKSRPDVVVIDLDDEYRAGDICWLETPINPTGESRQALPNLAPDIKYYADKIHKVGGKLLVDSTFGPPPLQYPFKFGADYILHSGTKYFGGHSDLLAGVLVVKHREEWMKLWNDRTYIGGMMGSLEAWLLLRSLKTLHLRVVRQSESATKLAQWLDKIANTPAGQSYDGVPGGTVVKQMEGGYNATFSILLKDGNAADRFQHMVKYFIPATSLGGVESLVERRLNSDLGADPKLIRLSVGVEEFEDLQSDIRRALQILGQTKAKM